MIPLETSLYIHDRVRLSITTNIIQRMYTTILDRHGTSCPNASRSWTVAASCTGPGYGRASIDNEIETFSTKFYSCEVWYDRISDSPRRCFLFSDRQRQNQDTRYEIKHTSWATTILETPLYLAIRALSFFVMSWPLIPGRMAGLKSDTVTVLASIGLAETTPATKDMKITTGAKIGAKISAKISML